ncbi:hypothetical protein RCZ04_09990 [Capnocytophaga sp. HP1101]
MARSRNVILNGLSGMIGKTFVFRKFKGQTVVSKAPSKSRVPASEAQLGCRSKFQEAVRYAQLVLKNPQLRASYETLPKVKNGNTSVYHAAITAFLNNTMLEI